MNVMPTSSCSALSSICSRLRSFASSAPSGSSSRRTFGFRIERPRERHPLLLSAGELRGSPLRELAHLDELESPADAVGGLGLRRLLVLQAERDVLLHVQVREQRVVLEDRVDVALVRRGLGHVLTIEEDLAFRRTLEASDHPEGRGLPTTGRTEHREELARWHLQVDARDGREIAEALHEVDELHLSTGHDRRSLSRPPPGGSTELAHETRQPSRAGGDDPDPHASAPPSTTTVVPVM